MSANDFLREVHIDAAKVSAVLDAIQTLSAPAYVFCACTSCSWTGHERDLIAQSCPLCDGRVQESMTPFIPEALERISGAVQLAAADFMIEVQKADTWADLVPVLGELDKAVDLLMAIRGSALEREKGLAQP